jgi:GNAT superfamily N-acetyltransferase
MRGVQISYLIEHPEYIPQLAQWLFQQWDVILGEGSPEARIKKLKTHMNRDKLPIAWVAHANGQLLGTAALRVHDLEGREDLTPWLGGVFVSSHFRRQGIGAALCDAVENGAQSRLLVNRDNSGRAYLLSERSEPDWHLAHGPSPRRKRLRPRRRATHIQCC